MPDSEYDTLREKVETAMHRRHDAAIAGQFPTYSGPFWFHLADAATEVIAAEIAAQQHLVESLHKLSTELPALLSDHTREIVDRAIRHQEHR